MADAGGACGGAATDASSDGLAQNPPDLRPRRRQLDEERLDVSDVLHELSDAVAQVMEAEGLASPSVTTTATCASPSPPTRQSPWCLCAARVGGSAREA